MVELTKRAFLAAAPAAALAFLSSARAAPLVVAPDTAAPFDIVALGDSLTAGYGLPRTAAFPAQLERELRALGFDVRIANAGVNGDTTADALRRLDSSVPAAADAVLVALGANDMLRAADPKIVRKNLDTIITRLQARGQKVALIGMYAHPLTSRDYAAAFNGLFQDLADKHEIALDPFMLDGVALTPAYTLDDLLHPNAAGVRVMAQRLAPFVARAFALSTTPPA